MDRNAIAAYLAGLTEEQFAEFAAEARADLTPAARVAAAETAGDWAEAFRLKTAMLQTLMNPQPGDD